MSDARSFGDTRASSSTDVIRASGGLLAPRDLYGFGQPFQVTYRVQNPLRRWWFRRKGFSTEWTVEYDPSGNPVREALPSFVAMRGGVEIQT